MDGSSEQNLFFDPLFFSFSDHTLGVVDPNALNPHSQDHHSSFSDGVLYGDPSNVTPQASSEHQGNGNNPVPPYSNQNLALSPGLQKILQSLLSQSSRPRPSWIPDCSVSLQDQFQPPGLLWAFTFECLFEGCRYTTRRNDTSSYEGYVRSVWAHLLTHADDMPKGTVLNDCGWEGCQSRGLNFKSTRDKMRHIVTHQPWFTLCTQCGRLSARRDSRGAIDNPCATGSCSPWVDFAERIRLANQNARYLGADFTISDYFDIVSQG